MELDGGGWGTAHVSSPTVRRCTRSQPTTSRLPQLVVQGKYEMEQKTRQQGPSANMYVTHHRTFIEMATLVDSVYVPSFWHRRPSFSPHGTVPTKSRREATLNSSLLPKPS